MRVVKKSLRALNPMGFHRLSYLEWGEARNGRTAVLAHGLTRNARDFDALALTLAEAGWRAVCPDIVGRGKSDWLPAPELYGYPQYLSDMAALIARLGVEEVDWIGTSMGGLIGMNLAAQPGTPIKRLVLNDIGPFIPKTFIERLAAYVGKDPTFADLVEAESYVRATYAAFGPLLDVHWQHLTEQGVRPREAGGFGLAYDPAIGDILRQGPFEDVETWQVWDAIACPVLVLRGAESDLLLPETVARMQASGPGCDVIEVEGSGHAPAFFDEGLNRMVADWLATA